MVNQLYVHTNDIDVKLFSGYSRDVDKWFWPKITWGDTIGLAVGGGVNGRMSNLTQKMIFFLQN